MFKGTILLVDDNQEELEHLSELITEQGHEVIMAPNGLEAITQLNERMFHLILAKIPMLTLNGIELLHIVQERWHKKIPVIFLTDQVNVETTFVAIKEGARDLLLKPFDKNTLLQCIQYHLEAKSLPTREELEQQYRERLQQHQTGQSYKKNVADLLSLDEITKALSMAAEPKDVGWTIMNMVQQLIEANRIALAVYGYDSQDKYFCCTYSDQLGILDELCPFDQQVEQWLLAHHKELIATNVEQEAKYLGFSQDQIQPGSLLALPFLSQESICGLMILFKAEKSYFNTTLVRFLSALSRIASLALEKIKFSQELKLSSVGIIRALVSAVEAKDAFTLGHSTRVGRYALLIAKQLDLNKEEIRHLEYLALLHDVGKIDIPEYILRKSTELTENDWKVIKSHSELGASIVQYLSFLPDGAKIILHHHEWFNGKGYPQGLAGEDIPLFSRIISIADAFDSMTTETGYKAVMSIPAALAELQTKAGEQFDPQLVQIFTQAFPPTDKSKIFHNVSQ